MCHSGHILGDCPEEASLGLVAVSIQPPRSIGSGPGFVCHLNSLTLEKDSCSPVIKVSRVTYSGKSMYEL